MIVSFAALEKDLKQTRKGKLQKDIQTAIPFLQKFVLLLKVYSPMITTACEIMIMVN